MQAEKHFSLRRLGGGDWGVEGVDQGRGDFEVANDGGGEIWLERFGGRQRGVQSPMAAADEVEAGIGVAFSAQDDARGASGGWRRADPSRACMRRRR